LAISDNAHGLKKLTEIVKKVIEVDFQFLSTDLTFAGV